MVTWSEAQLNAHESKAHRLSSGAKPEPIVRHEPVGSSPRETQNPGRIVVRIVSFRQRLLDPDNLCPKWFIDGLRYAGLIPGDREEDITLEVRQFKVRDKAGERTEIELVYSED
jgi:hypothetical protein